MRVAIFALFLVLGGKLSVLHIKRDVNCGFLIDALFRLKDIPSIPTLLLFFVVVVVFILNGC